MSGTTASLCKVDAPRVALATAIAGAAKAQDAVAEAEQSLQRGRQMVLDAEQALEAATARVAHARQRDGAAAAKAVKARGGTATADATRKARADRDAAEDGLEISRSAVVTLEEDLAHAEVEAAWRVNDVMKARNAVLASIATAIIERGREARLAAVIAENVLTELLYTKSPALDFRDTLDKLNAADQRAAPLRAIQEEVEFFSAAGVGDDERAVIDEAIGSVREFVSRLETDAAAAMPEIMG